MGDNIKRQIKKVRATGDVPAIEDRKVHATLFFRLPKPQDDVLERGSRIEVRVESGEWLGGYRLVTIEHHEHGKVMAWITPEAEWLTAKAESRLPDGAPWPIEQMRASTRDSFLNEGLQPSVA